MARVGIGHVETLHGESMVIRLTTTETRIFGLAAIGLEINGAQDFVIMNWGDLFALHGLSTLHLLLVQK